ncbi:hypothetical protein B0A48_04168 [Cryoendolithus antarcticus]|uniref:Apple domain-containing protein n=1 Tax=Cryoendolithus antarcticus TaxID=1507870 RepID=A0A1V8THK3_9PEZI|nr:hypothetical protein B0A48_04168 [Cryoendolithus antarcticus]
MNHNLSPQSAYPEALRYSNLPETAQYDGLEHEQPWKILAASDNVVPSLEVDTDGGKVEKHHAPVDFETDPQPSRNSRRICGLSLRASWVALAVVAALLVGAGVGAGVGVSVRSRQPSQSATTTIVTSSVPVESTRSTSLPALTTAATTPDASVTTSTPSLTTTQVPEGTSTLLRDCPSSNNTLYSYPSPEAPMVFRKFCEKAMYAIAGTFEINQRTASLDECIGLCAEYNVQNKAQIAKSQSPICNAVCWRNGNAPNDFPGQCFSWQTTNSSDGNFAFGAGNPINCDSGTLINQQLV